MNGWCLSLFLMFRKCRGGYPYLEDPRANARILCIARDALQSLAHGLPGGRYINLLVPLRSRFKYQKVHPFINIYIYIIYDMYVYNVYIVCIYIYILYVCIFFSLDDRLDVPVEYLIQGLNLVDLRYPSLNKS